MLEKDLKNLEIFVKGPNDSLIYFDDKFITGIQEFSFEQRDDQFFPLVGFKFAFLDFADIKKPEIEEDTIRIVVENFNSLSNPLCITKIYLGNKQIGLVSNLSFKCSVLGEKPEQILSLNYYVDNEKHEKLPEWVKINYLELPENPGIN